MCVCVYLLLGHRLGQRATAVAESPTSKTEEQGLIPAGGAVSPDPSNLHGPHTITWTDRQTDRQLSRNNRNTLALVKHRED